MIRLVAFLLAMPFAFWATVAIVVSLIVIAEAII